MTARGEKVRRVGAAAKPVGDSRAAATPDRVGAAETARAFAGALLGGDVAAATAYFGAEARFLSADGTELNSRRSIAALLGQLTSTSDQLLEIRSGRTVVADRVALCTQYWTRSATSPDAERFQVASTARLVLAREERRWQILIVAPWG